MIDINATLQGAERIAAGIKAAQSKTVKAQDTAVRVEGFRLMMQLRKEIRMGRVGGTRFAPLSYMARRAWGGKRLRPDRPLAAFAKRIGYETTRVSPISLRFGFVGKASSDTWRRLARKHQQGFTLGDFVYKGIAGKGMDDETRRMFARTAGGLGKGAAGRRMLFLRKSTRTFRTPARPIIEPFWRANQIIAMNRIRENFRRKLRGERI